MYFNALWAHFRKFTELLLVTIKKFEEHYKTILYPISLDSTS